MSVRDRLAAFGVALVLLAALDVVIVHVDVFGLLLPRNKPVDLSPALDWQMAQVLHTLRQRPSGPPPVVVFGNSQMDAATKPLGALESELAARGAQAGTRVVSLCVLATAPTDTEVLSREIGRLHPGLVLIGLSPPDLGTPLERARSTFVVRILDTGIRDGLVPPASTEMRLQRWLGTVWQLYRFRMVFHAELLPPPGRTVVVPSAEGPVATRAAMLEMFYGPEEARTLLALRDRYDESRDFADFVRFVDALRGPDYLLGLRERWRELIVQPFQLEALRRLVANVRAVGGRPVWVLLPENPVFEQDPEVGSLLVRHSDEVTAAVRAEAERLGVPLLDLRRKVDASQFLDLNHLDFGALQPLLATTLAERNLL